MDDFRKVIDFISIGAYTLDQLHSQFSELSRCDLEEMLDGMVMFSKIKYTNGYYHGNDVIAPDKNKRQFTGNGFDHTGVVYPEWVKSDIDKVKFLTSEDAPKFQKTAKFFADDINTQETGRIIYDVMNSNHIMTTYYLEPNKNGGGNVVAHKIDVTQSRSMTILFSNGKFTVNAPLLKSLIPKYANAKTESYVDRFVKEFNSFEELAVWIKKNV